MFHPAASPLPRRACSAPTKAGSRCRSGAWASPAPTSTAAATPPTSSPAWPTTSSRCSPRVAAKPQYRDVAFAKGVTAHRPFAGGDVHPSTAWHAQFADVNNDGWLDLFVVKGNVGNMPDFALLDPSNLLLGGPDGRYVEAAGEPGLLNYQRGRGGLMVDLNGDGLLDARHRQPLGTRQALAQCRCRQRGQPRSRSAIGCRCACARTAATAMRSVPGSRSRPRPRAAPRAGGRRRACQRHGRLPARRARRRDGGARARVVAGCEAGRCGIDQCLVRRDRRPLLRRRSAARGSGHGRSPEGDRDVPARRGRHCPGAGREPGGLALQRRGRHRVVARRAAGDPADARAVAAGRGAHARLPRSRPVRIHRRRSAGAAQLRGPAESNSNRCPTRSPTKCCTGPPWPTRHWPR